MSTGASNTSDLEAGAYYWVQPQAGMEWEPAQYMGGEEWEYLGIGEDLVHGEPDVIGPRLQPPGSGIEACPLCRRTVYSDPRRHAAQGFLAPCGRRVALATELQTPAICREPAPAP